MKPTLLVLAAGMGSRYGGLKQMDPMGPHGETVLDYSVYDAIRAGFGRVVFIIREDFAEAFQQGVGARFANRIQVDYAFQKSDDLPTGFSTPEGRSKPWGTAHAVRSARKLVKEPFAVINADDFYGSDAYLRAAKFLTTPQASNAKAHYAMVGYPLINTLSDHGDVNRGICTLDDHGLLSSVEEYVKIERDADGVVRGNSLDGARKSVTEDAPVSMNFWAFTPSFFDYLETGFTDFLTHFGQQEKSEYYIPTAVDALIRSGKADCTVLETTSRWFGVTYPDDKKHVVASIAKLIESGEYPAPLS
ncbi:MAG: sugar phosphate nucleotidyltransferase [Akkermansiaceae bacterium]|nr:sugar phosphate nucleotidyltransferase [Akkermansiaceae bacterium]